MGLTSWFFRCSLGITCWFSPVIAMPKVSLRRPRLGVAGDQLRHDAAHGLNAQGQGGHVQPGL